MRRLLTLAALAGAVLTLAGPAHTQSAKPAISSFAPSQGIRGSSVMIEGSVFGSSPRVKFGSAPSKAVTVDGGATIRAVVPGDAVTGKITVTTAAGSATSATEFGVILPPTITSISPRHGAVGSTVTIRGTFLGVADRVTFGGVDAGAITHVSRTQLTVEIPDGVARGAFRVYNPAGRSARSTSQFSVVPAVVSYDPPTGAGRREAVTIYGTGFVGATVGFGGVPAVVDSSDSTSIHTHVPATADRGPMTIMTAGGSADGPTFHVLPAVYSVSAPAHVGEPLTITGSLLDGAIAVSIGGVNVPDVRTNPFGYRVVNSRTITAFVPGSTTTGPVTVTTRRGTSRSDVVFHVLPNVDDLYPHNAFAGETVHLYGGGFYGSPQVRFNGILSPSVIVTSPTDLDVVVPAGPTSGDVTVTTPDGTATSAEPFTVDVPGPLSLDSFSPMTGPTATPIGVRGTGFRSHPVTSVRFGTTPALFDVQNDRFMSVFVPWLLQPEKISISDGTTTVTSAQAYQVVTAATASQRIAYQRRCDIGPCGIWTISGVRTSETQLTSDPTDTEPAWSNDGTKIAFTRFIDGAPYVLTMTATGQSLTTVTAGKAPTWNADGTKLAFERGGAIWTADADGSSATKLTSGPNDHEPSWSRDGKRIAYVRRTATASILGMNPDGKGVVTVVSKGVSEDWDPKAPDWSPDGTKLVFVTSEGDFDFAHTINADGTGETQLSYGPSRTGLSDSHPSWKTCAGDRIAVASGDGVAVYYADGTGRAQISPGDEPSCWMP